MARACTPQQEINRRILDEVHRLGGRATTLQIASAANGGKIYQTPQAAALSVAFPIQQLIAEGLLEREKVGVYVIPGRKDSAPPPDQVVGLDRSRKRVMLKRSELLLAKTKIEARETTVAAWARRYNMTPDTLRRCFDRAQIAIDLQRKPRSDRAESQEEKLVHPPEPIPWDRTLSTKFLSMRL